ncbi:glycosyltransferase family 4 protein [Muricauda sp. SCSIO 64092]|uniref:glycosyltransferase n=1 Tax=Allomuricauda sp. SCSIO 64092 TaxID=2908842 RepID=UPI001FF42B0A|nr:glycosyltransferase [Muricauda sp. SCSIO 64092]UOY06449.1 glycosyltransferase family 4 protein [Muricauda sp. SCSIO 64092]
MKRLLVIGHIWPEPTTTAAGNRMLQLLRAFLDRDYEITFASVAVRTEYSHDLTAMGIEEVSIKLNHSSFEDLAKKKNPDIVVFDRFMVEEQFGWRIAESCPNALRVSNTEDLHSLREYREVCLKRDSTFTAMDWLQKDKTKREVASIFRSDLTLLVSSFEKSLLQGATGISESLLWCLPFMLEEISEAHRAIWPSFEERLDFISYGNGKHAPNVDSFTYLKKIIWPMIRRELPETRLHIYGAYLPQQVKDMHRPKDGILVHGWISDLEKKVEQARMVLAPLRFGAGIKGKLAVAMQCGTPSITTDIGKEGMAMSSAWAGFIADDPKDFAQRAVALYQEKRIWQEAQKKGIQLINTNYNRELLAEKLFKKVNLMLQNLEDHRNKNIIGTLLRHQTMNATKYMGKWIEEKNKKS